MEAWKSIVTDQIDYTGFYSVSSYGNVKNDVTGRVYKLCANSRGYIIVTLRLNNEFKAHSVHRLVALCFIANTENKPQVNHINGNRTDNNVKNLEWCTGSENVKHGYSADRCKNSFSQTRHSLGKNIKAKPVINIKTGERYDCATLVANLLGVKSRALCKKLSGESINNTDFAYLN